MVDLRSMRKHEVFFSLKRDLALVISLIAFFPLPLPLFLLILMFVSLTFMFLLLCKVVQSTHRVEEIANSSHRMTKNKEAMCIATVEAFRVADKKS